MGACVNGRRFEIGFFLRAAVVAAVLLLGFWGIRRIPPIRKIQEPDRRASTARTTRPALETENSGAKLFFQKGVNFTAEYPDIYGSDRANDRLRQLKKYGVNAIAIVPYGFASEGSARLRFNLGWERDGGVTRVADLAHKSGMKVLLKPQLFVRNGYPGSLEFPETKDRARWFAQYRIFLEHYARLATEIHADLFCVGVEFDKLSKDAEAWRSLIARARELYSGPLVYAANFGDEFENVEFWDALDYIGMDEYYSLPDNLSTEELVRRVEAVQKRFQRPVIFTEVGFPSVAGGNRNPWDEPPEELSLELQARCYEEIFRAFYEKPWFAGMYWW
ncbi:MAG: hypothetical protein JSS69_18165, partial [Acidobacteria bacterium]|nr:hypothetical protein [Acidobacteriota bacterium]